MSSQQQYIRAESAPAAAVYEAQPPQFAEQTLHYVEVQQPPQSAERSLHYVEVPAWAQPQQQFAPAWPEMQPQQLAPPCPAMGAPRCPATGAMLMRCPVTGAAGAWMPLGHGRRGRR